jgi:hypothetical protein
MIYQATVARKRTTRLSVHQFVEQSFNLIAQSAMGTRRGLRRPRGEGIQHEAPDNNPVLSKKAPH